MLPNRKKGKVVDTVWIIPGDHTKDSVRCKQSQFWKKRVEGGHRQPTLTKVSRVQKGGRRVNTLHKESNFPPKDIVGGGVERRRGDSVPPPNPPTAMQNERMQGREKSQEYGKVESYIIGPWVEKRGPIDGYGNIQKRGKKTEAKCWTGQMQWPDNYLGGNSNGNDQEYHKDVGQQQEGKRGNLFVNEICQDGNLRKPRAKH